MPENSVFTVEATPAGGIEAGVNLASSGGVTVSGSTVVLKLAVPIAHNDGSVRVTYEKPGTGAVIEDANGNDAADFTDQAVTNNSAVPRVSIERVHADASSLIAHPVFLIRRSNTGTGTEALIVGLSLSQDDTYLDNVNPTDFIVSGQTEKEVTLPLDYAGNTNGDLTVTVVGRSGYAPAVAPNNAATVQVKAPASGLPLSVRFSQASWTVDEGATVAPTLTFTLAPGLAEPRDSFTVPLETAPEVATSGDDFVTYPGPRATAEPGDWEPASGGGKTQTVAITYVTLQDTFVEPNEIFHLRFDRVNDSTDSADIPKTLPDERTTISILDDDPLVVTDVEVTSTPTGGYYDIGNKIEFKVTFSGLVEAGGGPQFAFDLGGATRQAAYASGSDTKDLVFSYTVVNTDADDGDGISWGANALSLNGGTIVAAPSKDLLVPRNADLDHAAQAALPAQKVDTMKPSLAGAAAQGTTLTLTFSEDLNTTAPANTVFAVKVDGAATGTNPNAVSISGSEVSLTMASAMTPGQVVTVTYTKPTANPIKDLSGKEADAFTDKNVTTAPPVAVTATFTQVSYLVDEGMTVDVTVRLNKDPERRLTIPLTATSLNGAITSDYSLPAGVTFASGDTENTVTFTAVDDMEDDDGETVHIAFGTLPTGVTAGAHTSILVAIQDDDDPEVTVNFAKAMYDVEENGNVTVTVQLSADAERQVIIPLTATPQGGATSTDYLAPPTMVTFVSGETEQTFTFTATQDTDDDDGESILLGFGTPLPDRVTTGTQAESTVNIADDDGPGVNVIPLNLNVAQGRSATYTVVLATQPTSEVTVTPASDNTDVTFAPATITFQTNEWNTRMTVTVSAPAGSAGETATITHDVSGYQGVTTVPSVAVTVTETAPARASSSSSNQSGSSSGGGGSSGGDGGGGGSSNRPLAITGPRNIQYPEHGTEPVATYKAEDSEGQEITWQIEDTDAEHFRISEDGVLSFKTPPDYENPVDFRLNNTYEIRLIAVDNSIPRASGRLQVNIEIKRVNELDPVSGDAQLSVEENHTGVLAQYEVEDPEGDAIAWSLSGPDAALFQIDEAGSLSLNTPLDFEALGSVAGPTTTSFPSLPQMTESRRCPSSMRSPSR